MLNVHPRLKWRKEGEGYLTNTSVYLNETAIELLEILQKTHNPEDVIIALERKYPHISSSLLRKDVNDTIENLKKIGYLTSSTEKFTRKDIQTPQIFEKIHVPVPYFNKNRRLNLSAPMRVAFEITYACNARCKHCYAYSNTVDKNELSTEECVDFIRQLGDLNVFEIFFTGGEPLLRKDLEKLIVTARDNNISPAIFSNGLLLTKNRIEMIASAGLWKAQVSLHAPNAKSYEKFSGVRGIFERVMTAIPMLVDNGVRVSIAITLMTLNINEISNMIDQTHDLGVNEYKILPFFEVGKGGSNSYLTPKVEEYIDVIRTLINKQKEHDLYIHYPELPARFYAIAVGEKRFVRGISPDGITQCTINPTGDVRASIFFRDNLLAGNIRVQPFKEIWDEAKIFQRLRYPRWGMFESPCKECSFLKTCRGGERGYAHREYSPDPRCIALS